MFCMSHTPNLILFCATLLCSLLIPRSAMAAAPRELRELVGHRVNAEYPSLFNIYTNLHRHPELSFMEVKTAALVAKELRAVGFTVTEKVGKTGVVGVLANGPGPTILLRADMDGLPIKENSGVPYASTDIVKDISGQDQ